MPIYSLFRLMLCGRSLSLSLSLSFFLSRSPSLVFPRPASYANDLVANFWRLGVLTERSDQKVVMKTILNFNFIYLLNCYEKKIANEKCFNILLLFYLDILEYLNMIM